jgi:hypothetical protein
LGTVPVASRYAGRAAELACRAGDGFIFRPGPADRGYKNFASDLAASLARDLDAPRLPVSRCRSSFICDHLVAGTSLHDLLVITGIAEAPPSGRIITTNGHTHKRHLAVLSVRHRQFCR